MLLERKDKKIIENNKDGSSVTLYDLEVIIPKRYSKLALAHIGVTVSLMAIMAIKYDEKHYNTYTYPAFITITPTKTTQFEYEGKEYYSFFIAKGKPFANRQIVQDPSVIKTYVEESIMKGQIPFFLGLYDLRECFENFYKYTGSHIADDDVVIDVMISLAARTKKNYKTHLRHVEDKSQIAWVGINNVALSREDGFNRMTGAYLRDGLVASSLDEFDNTTKLEEILK